MKKFFSFFAAMLIAVAANAAVINITNETPDALRLALNSAADGDEIVMAAGTYVESNGNYIAFDGKSVTVKAAEGANVLIQPQVPITITNGAYAKFENIKFDVSRLTELATWYEHLIYATDANEANSLSLKGCEFYGFTLNKSMLYCSSSNRLANVYVDNCYFHNIMKSILFVENTAAIKVQITNSTIANITTDASSYYAGVIDVRATDADFLVDHCTFYDAIPMNTDYSAVSKVTLTKGVVSNSIFMLATAQDGIRAMRGVTANNCITYNYLKDSGTGIHSSVTKNNCTQVDPKFVDAANGNYTLGEGSPALTMNDGQPIGDPRWVPSVEPEVKYYLKNNWDAASDWTWKEMTKIEDDNYQLKAVFGGTGVNVNTAESDEGSDWYPIENISTFDVNVEQTTLKAKDTVVFVYTPSEKSLAAIVVGPYVEPEPQPVMTAVYSWADKIGTTILGTTGVEVSTVKIHENTDEIPAIKFGNSYVYADGKWLAIKPAEGGFKAGDVVSISGVISNSDDTGAKYAQIDMYAADGATRLLRTENVVNGRVSANDPFVDVITLESDQDSLFFGRYGNTTMFITMLKVERAGGAPEPEFTYTVAGSSEAAFGTAWDPTNADNDMVKVPDGTTYNWIKSDIALAKGEISFKVCENHSWDKAWPAQDYKLAIESDGIYTISISFDPATGTVDALATKTGEAVVIPTIAMHGNFQGGWADTENFEIAEGDETASLKLTLAAGNYEFGMRIGGSGNWTANGVSFSRENASAEVVSGSGNLKLEADKDGDYVFTWTYATNTLSISFPVASGIDNTNVAVKAQKVIINGQLFIIRDGQMFNAQGQLQ